jgi:hypothetical protein
VTTQPKPIDAALVTQVPIGQPARPGSFAFVITTAGPTSTPFAGRWQAAFPASPDGTVQLSVNGTSVTGTIALAAPAQSGSLQIYDGRIDGNAITFRVKSPTGGRTITFTGTLKGNDIVFTREVDVPPDGQPGGAGIFGAFGARTFTATRVQ